MQKQNLLIHNSTTLYDILFEIKHLVSFNIKEISNLEIEEQSFHALDLIISMYPFLMTVLSMTDLN